MQKCPNLNVAVHYCHYSVWINVCLFVCLDIMPLLLCTSKFNIVSKSKINVVSLWWKMGCTIILSVQVYVQKITVAAYKNGHDDGTYKQYKHY